MTVALLLVAAIVYGIIRFTRREIVTPLFMLRQGVDILRKGDLSHRIQVSGHDNDVIGLLVGTLNDMADRVEARTRELTIANVKVKEEARLKSEFMSTMSHELRTPLNAMIGFTGIMLTGMGGEFDEEARHMLERIDSNSVRLLGLINEILDLAKIEAGRMEIVSKPLSTRALAQDWQSQMSVLAEQKGLDFKAEIDPRLPEQLYGDRERLTQVALNLLSNAIKFTDQGGIKLALQLEGLHWTIEVEDTGVGIPTHALNYVFDEFRQVDGTPTRAYGGSGLGLAIVRNLCRMMGGNVRARSALGVGSVFTVTLPLITIDSLSPAYQVESA